MELERIIAKGLVLDNCHDFKKYEFVPILKTDICQYLVRDYQNERKIWVNDKFILKLSEKNYKTKEIEHNDSSIKIQIILNLKKENFIHQHLIIVEEEKTKFYEKTFVDSVKLIDTVKELEEKVKSAIDYHIESKKDITLELDKLGFEYKLF